MKTGPKTEPFLENLRPRSLMLDDLTMTQASVLGEGNVSYGVRAAIRWAYDCYQADRFTPGKPTAEPGARPPELPTVKISRRRPPFPPA